MRSDRFSRRRFLIQASAVTALSASSWSKVYGAGEKLRVAAVGVGGKGWSDLTSVAASPRLTRRSSAAWARSIGSGSGHSPAPKSPLSCATCFVRTGSIVWW